MRVLQGPVALGILITVITSVARGSFACSRFNFPHPERRAVVPVYPSGVVVRGLHEKVHDRPSAAKEHRSRARGGARVRHLDHQPGADRAGLTVKIRCQNLVALSRSVFLTGSRDHARDVLRRRDGRWLHCGMMVDRTCVGATAPCSVVVAASLVSARAYLRVAS